MLYYYDHHEFPMFAQQISGSHRVQVFTQPDSHDRSPRPQILERGAGSESEHQGILGRSIDKG